MDFEKLRQESAAVGLNCTGMLNGVPVVEGDEILAALVVAAHGKTTDDSEVPALRDFLGETDQRWLDYVIVRKNAVRELRNEKFRTLTDPMILDTLENSDAQDLGDGFCTIQIPIDSLNAWKAAKEAIRSELPYEVE